jgi:hypothetical protein
MLVMPLKDGSTFLGLGKTHKRCTLESTMKVVREARPLQKGECLAFALILIFLVDTCHSAEPYIKVSAEIEIEAASWSEIADHAGATVSGGHTNRRTVAFVCILGTNEWQLDGDFSRNGHHKWFFDGTNVYESIQITKPPRSDATNAQISRFFPPLEQVRSNLTINVHATPGGYLSGADPVENIPWLAFCSAAYLKRPGRTVPLPTALLDHTPDAFGYSDRTSTFEDELGLPQTVELLTSKLLYAASVSRFAEAAHWQKKPDLNSGFPDGLVTFRYTVTDSTNFEGHHLPLKFEFSDVMAHGFGSAMRSYSGEGRVLEIGRCPERGGVFDPSLKQVIVDWRFRHNSKAVTAIVYPWTNNYLAPTNNPALQARFAAQVKIAPHFVWYRRRRAKIFIWLLFFSASVLTATGLFFRAGLKT